MVNHDPAEFPAQSIKSYYRERNDILFSIGDVSTFLYETIRMTH